LNWKEFQTFERLIAYYYLSLPKTAPVRANGDVLSTCETEMIQHKQLKKTSISSVEIQTLQYFFNEKNLKAWRTTVGKSSNFCSRKTLLRNSATRVGNENLKLFTFPRNKGFRCQPLRMLSSFETAVYIKLSSKFPPYLSFCSSRNYEAQKAV